MYKKLKTASSTTTDPMNERSHRPPILKPDESYTFRSYFLMKFAPADILRELGVTLTRAAIELPVSSPVQLSRLPDLRQRLEGEGGVILWSNEKQ